MADLALHALQSVWQATLAPAARRFRQALGAPAAAQAARLRQTVAANADTDYGRRHDFSAIDSVTAFQDRVPVTDHDALAPWISRVAAGEQRVLTRAPALMFERSSGSSAAAKLVPYTAALRAEFSAATGAWLHDLHARRPALRGTRSYWSVSPATRAAQRTAGGLPIGFDDDTEYFGPLERLALRRLLAVPPEVARLPDVTAWRRRTCRELLAADDLGLISVWSPSFLTLLMQAIADDWDALLADLPPARRRALRRAVPDGAPPTGELLWPRLALVSCWADGPARDQLADLRRWFPATPLQPKGLLATEGVVSIPWGAGSDATPGDGDDESPQASGAVLAVTSHFLEFIDLDRPAARPLLAHELRPGGAYSPLITTGGGLYRYHLKDVVRCVGLVGRTPRVRFEGRLDKGSDRAGEKLNAHHVGQALTRAADQAGLAHRFALLAPLASTPPRYRLYVDTDAPAAAVRDALGRLEAGLRDNPHYDYCRRLGQLGVPDAVRVTDGWARYVARQVQRGVRAGDVKPTPLDAGLDWDAVFPGAQPLGVASLSTQLDARRPS